MSARIVQILIAGVVLITSVQALYWPLIPKPGTVLSWWQVEWLARLGNYIGAPALLLVIASPLSGSVQEIFGWLCVLGWCISVYLLAGVAIRYAKKAGVGSYLSL